ncbi:hypothetical protein LU293_03545 [Moraxella nasovis]|uniref:hypothetical protein n=1 Tax=Moraxella nasovis TaxID=2904121 RepID=UPI001F61798A|nr:hypothetical protein [Moraxella nasovis]UNU73978.1 hypothetical protein LU293_03545 [Moraxella nasovis]
MDIFQNDAQVLSIGNLTIENGTTSIIISGDVEINQTDTGRQQAKALQEFANALIAWFDEQGTQEIQPVTNPLSEVDNPFA